MHKRKEKKIQSLKIRDKFKANANDCRMWVVGVWQAQWSLLTVYVLLAYIRCWSWKKSRTENWWIWEANVWFIRTTEREEEGGRRGSLPFPLMTTSGAKTREGKKTSGLWSRSGGTTPALPLPETLPLSLAPSLLLLLLPLQRELGEEVQAELSPLRPLSSPHSAPPSASFFVFSFSLIPPFPFSPHGHYFLDLLLIPFPQPLLTPDTTKSAACGFNGNQTLSRSPLVRRLLLLYSLISSWLCSVSARRFYRLTLHKSKWLLFLF